MRFSIGLPQWREERSSFGLADRRGLAAHGPQHPEEPQQLDPQQLPQQPLKNLRSPCCPRSPRCPRSYRSAAGGPAAAAPAASAASAARATATAEPQQEPQQPAGGLAAAHHSSLAFQRTGVKQSPGQHPMVLSPRSGRRSRTHQSSPSLMATNPTAAFISSWRVLAGGHRMLSLLLFMPVLIRTSH